MVKAHQKMHTVVPLEHYWPMTLEDRGILKAYNFVFFEFWQDIAPWLRDSAYQLAENLGKTSLVLLGESGRSVQSIFVVILSYLHFCCAYSTQYMFVPYHGRCVQNSLGLHRGHGRAALSVRGQGAGLISRICRGLWPFHSNDVSCRKRLASASSPTSSG